MPWSPFRGLSRREIQAATNTSGYDIPCKSPECSRMIRHGERMIPIKIRRASERVSRGCVGGERESPKPDGWQCLEHAKK